jgi:hypothetical protein
MHELPTSAEILDAEGLDIQYVHVVEPEVEDDPDKYIQWAEVRT